MVVQSYFRLCVLLLFLFNKKLSPLSINFSLSLSHLLSGVLECNLIGPGISRVLL